MDYKLSRLARANIKEIIRYTDQNFGPSQTREYLDGLYYSFDLLVDNPKLGREWSQGKRRYICLLYTSPSPRDRTRSRMPSSA